MSAPSEVAGDKLATRNGACVACACEAFELKGHADGFPICACHHTRWAHKDTWVPGKSRRTP